VFSRNGPIYGAWRWQYLSERRAEASSRKFQAYSPGGATLFDTASDDDVRGAATS